MPTQGILPIPSSLPSLTFTQLTPTLTQWTLFLSITPLLALALYIHTNDRKLKRIPEAARFFSQRRVRVGDVLEMDGRIRSIREGKGGGETGKAGKGETGKSLEERERESMPGRTGRRYIVVGGAGFLGGWIVTKLLERGEDLRNIRIIDIAPPSGHHVVKEAVQRGMQFVRVDVTDGAALEGAFRAPWPSSSSQDTPSHTQTQNSQSDPDPEPEITVFHTAANIRFYERHLSFLPRSWRVNVGGTQNVLSAAKAVGASVLVYTSSGSVCLKSTRLLLWPWEREPERFVQVVRDGDARGVGEEGEGKEEAGVPRRHEDFFSNYAATKIEAERLVRRADKSVLGVGHGGKVMRTGCIRPGNGIFGPRGDMLCGAYLVRQTNPTWIGTVVQSFSYVENCAVAHLCYEARLIELQEGNKDRNPDIGGQAFCVADPGPPRTYGDAYTVLETLSEGECTFPTLSPTLMLLFAHGVEKYYLAQHWLSSRAPSWLPLGRLLPEVKGEIVNLQPALFYLTSVHLIFDDSRARLPKEKGGLGYGGTWTTLEGLHKTVEEYKSGMHRVDTRSAGIGLGFFGGGGKKRKAEKGGATVKVMPTPVAPVELVIPPQYPLCLSSNSRESQKLIYPVTHRHLFLTLTMSSEAPSSSNWHAVRPWAPSLSLTVREITSVSATFILSSAYAGDIDASLAEIGLDAAGQAQGQGQVAQDDLATQSQQDSQTLNGNGNGAAPSASVSATATANGESKPSSVIADALAKGLSVNVNGSAWPRAFIRIDDQLAEAVIIIYALMPGRQYDIELALASMGQPSTPIRRQVTTEGESLHSSYLNEKNVCADLAMWMDFTDDSDGDTAEVNTDPESPTLDNSTASDPHSTPSTSPSRT
ncbi:hypothetical protein CVT26_006042, partial [Gymnopilus dilepis]